MNSTSQAERQLMYLTTLSELKQLVHAYQEAFQSSCFRDAILRIIIEKERFLVGIDGQGEAGFSFEDSLQQLEQLVALRAQVITMTPLFRSAIGANIDILIKTEHLHEIGPLNLIDRLLAVYKQFPTQGLWGILVLKLEYYHQASMAEMRRM